MADAIRQIGVSEVTYYIWQHCQGAADEAEADHSPDHQVFCDRYRPMVEKFRRRYPVSQPLLGE